MGNDNSEQGLPAAGTEPEVEQVYDEPAESATPGDVRDPSADRMIIAKTLVWIMAGGLLLHYSAVVTLELVGKPEAVKSLEPIFNAWLPVMSGLVGAAVTFYFTRERR